MHDELFALSLLWPCDDLSSETDCLKLLLAADAALILFFLVCPLCLTISDPGVLKT